MPKQTDLLICIKNLKIISGYLMVSICSYNKIFTFINFPNHTPAYINLCIKTWRQHLQNRYQLIILTPENINKYIDKKFLTEQVLNPADPYSAIFCDYISFIVLYCNGGIFLDADTIITDAFKPDFNILKQYETIFFSQNDQIIPGFIMAKKQSALLKQLILKYEDLISLPLKSNKRADIVNSVAKKILSENILLIDNKICAYKLEAFLMENCTNNNYKKYYFSPEYSIENFLKNNKGIAALKNTITPAKYKKMSEADFLKQNILLSKIFKVLI